MNLTAAIWLGWLALFLALELPAAMRLGVPWVTLSEFCWGLEDVSSVWQYTFLFGLSVLLTHIVARWPR